MKVLPFPGKEHQAGLQSDPEGNSLGVVVLCGGGEFEKLTLPVFSLFSSLSILGILLVCGSFAKPFPLVSGRGQAGALESHGLRPAFCQHWLWAPCGSE